jgi:hypothetical protein
MSGAEPHGKGIDHLDDRDPLAYAYDGETLAAICYNPQAVHLAEGFGSWTVVRTPDGERVFEGDGVGGDA